MMCLSKYSFRIHAKLQYWMANVLRINLPVNTFHSIFWLYIHNPILPKIKRIKRRFSVQRCAQIPHDTHAQKYLNESAVIQNCRKIL